MSHVFPRRSCLPAAGLAALIALAADPARPAPAPVPPVLSTEDVLNRLGVNTHLDGLSREDPWETDPARVGAQLRYLGVRLDRDWVRGPEAGRTWRAVQKEWGPFGRFWTSIDETGPAGQRRILDLDERLVTDFPGLVFAMGGPNEEDNPYPQGLGATLPDSAAVQKTLYAWAHGGGRDIPVSQMEFGAGWTAANAWQGDYNPTHTGLHQNYTPGPADLAAAHTYLHQPRQRPADVLAQLRALAHLTTPGKPVAHTEFGAYRSAGLTVAQYGQDMVLGCLDAVAAGDAAVLVYGLQDSGPEGTYGFFSFPGGTPHEAATDFHALTTLLASPRGGYGPGARPTFTPRPLPATFSSPAVSHLVMQKPTGDWVIAAWSEQVRDGHERPVTDVVDFGRTVPLVRVYDVEAGATPQATARRVRRWAVTLSPNDTYLLVISPH